MSAPIFAPSQGTSRYAWGLVLAAALWSVGPLVSQAEAMVLEDAVGGAVAAAPELEQSRLEVARAQVGLAQARGERLAYGAEVNVGNRFGISGILGPNGSQTANAPLANATLSASWPAFTGWRLEKGIEQAEASLASAEARLDDSTQAIALSATEAYWQAARAVLGLRLADYSLDKAKVARGMANSLVITGSRHSTELDRATLTVLDQETEKVRARETEARARIELGRLLRREVKPGEAMVAGGEPEAVWLVARKPMPGLDQVWAEAKNKRPDLKLASAQTASAYAQVGIAQSQRWPQANAITAYQHGNNPFIATSQNRSVLDSFVGTFDVRLNLSYQLFDNGAIGRNIESSERAFDAAVASASATEQRAKAEVADALVQQEAARDRLALSRSASELSEKVLKYMEIRYSLGFALLTELNDSRVSTVGARRRAIDAAIDWRLADARLARAVGRLAGQRGTR